jgi:hypothetical protein
VAAPAAATNASKAASGGLRIGEPNDVFEQEADRVANEAVANGTARANWSLSRIGIGTTLQRQCSCGGSAGAEEECEECQEKRLTLQRSAANQAEPSAYSLSGEHVAPDLSRLSENIVLRKRIQTKLRAGEPGDPYEQAADQAADTVMRTSQVDDSERAADLRHSGGAHVQHLCPVCDGANEKRVRGGGLPVGDEQEANVGGVRAQAEERDLQTKLSPGRGSPRLAPELEAYIGRLRGFGQPLPKRERDFFEPRLGHDFSRVRIHTDSQAAETATALQALAFTVGYDIVFGAAQYAPETPQGRRLLAHELTHVVQQGKSQRLRTSSGKQRGKEGSSVIAQAPLVSACSPPEALKARSPSSGTEAPAVQFDLAVAPPHPGAAAAPLTPKQIDEAIRFNQFRFKDPFTIRVVRDVIGLEPVPAIIDSDFVVAIAQWQAEQGLPQDGMVGPATTGTLVRELTGERQLALARQLRLDNFVTATTVGGPTFNNCTVMPRFRWDVSLNTTLRSGFIVQQMDSAFNAQDCAGNPLAVAVAPTPRYWEAWQVDAAGNVTPKVGGLNDRWQRNFPAPSRGNWSVTGTFFTLLALPPAAHFVGGGVHDAGILLSTVTHPGGDNLGLVAGGRRIGGNWDCCPPHNTHVRT